MPLILGEPSKPVGNSHQGKRWLLTFDNIDKHGITHEMLKESLSQFESSYYCMADEKTESGMLHTHLYFETRNNCRFETVKKRFPKIAHIDKACGTLQECRDYVRKEGKYLNSEKALTSLPETFEESGAMEEKESKAAGKKKVIMALIEQGLSDYQIIKLYPQFAFNTKEISDVRHCYLRDKYKNQRRFLEVSYLYGAPGTGKTKSIFDAFEGGQICRITSYPKGKPVYFDAYDTQDVLVFEEFYGQIPMEDMLNYLDIYPLELPARFHDRVACYTKVFITSNIPFKEQYREIQRERPEQWKAFCRRISTIKEFKRNGSIVEHRVPSWKEDAHAQE